MNSAVRTRTYWGWLFIPAAVIFATAACAAALPVRHGEAVFYGTGAQDTVFTLPVSWVLVDSVQVFRNLEPLAEYTDWRLADPGNRIWVYRPLRATDTLRVVFRYYPIPLLRTYLRHSLREIARMEADSLGGDTSRFVATAASETRESGGWTRLHKSGSLIRSIQVGTGQDLQLESALNLQIQGRIGKEIDVVAALTDQTTPIQPEGTTETISELEKVFVSVRTPRLSATLGDYTLDLSGGHYDGYSRKLTGVLGQAAIGPATLVAGGAVSRGQFFSNSFSGQEANQGPYPLHGRNGETGIVVLAGTEKVWLDGDVMRRGEGNDYTIDYASGEITFTSRRLMTSETRIVVDFEYTTEDYERFYGAGRVGVEFGNPQAGGSVTWISENDDRTRPIGLGLVESDRAILKSAGDSVALAVNATADSIGESGGDYVRRDTVFAGAEYSIYVFSSRDTLNQPTGQWRVSFDDFGVGNGDYEAAADSSGITYFRWIGPSMGRYRPDRRLPLPRQHSIADMRVHATPLRGFMFRGEVAASRLDLNTFSRKDDADNDGMAFSVSGEFERDKPRLFFVTPHRISANLTLRQRDRYFTELSRVSEVEFEREWDVVRSNGYSETIREASLSISPVRAFSVAAGYGDLDRANAYSSRRRNVGANLTAFKTWNFTASHVTLESEDSLNGRRGHWIRQGGRLTGGIWRISPRFAIDRERKRDELPVGYSGFRFLDWSGGSTISLPGNVAVGGEFRQRTDDMLNAANVFNRSSVARTWSSEGSWTPPELGRIFARYAHREKNYSASDSADVTSDAGRLEALIATRNRVIEANAIYEIAKTRTQNQILVAIQVPEGTGNYRREGNGYVPDDQGDYILVPRYTGSYEPVTELSFSSIFWLRPDELPSDDTVPWLHVVSSETELTIEEQTRKPLNARLALLDPAVFRGDSTLLGTVVLRQDIHLWRLSQRFAFRLRYRESTSLQNQFLNGGQSRDLREGGIRVRARYYSFWRGESELSGSSETSTYLAGTIPDRDVTRFDFTQVNTLILSHRWETGVDFRWSDARDERTETQMSLREVKPHAAFILLGRGRFDADATWIHGGSNQSVIPYELGRGANRGANFRWSVRGTYQFGQTFSGSLNYTGRRDAGEKTYHAGRLEVRASL